MAVEGPGWSVACPDSFAPQQSVAPPGLSPHVWPSPADTAAKERWVAVTVMSACSPDPVGVPASSPVVGSRVRPRGSAPAVTAHVASSLAVSWWS